MSHNSGVGPEHGALWREARPSLRHLFRLGSGHGHRDRRAVERGDGRGGDAGERRDAVDKVGGVRVLGVRVVQLVVGGIGASHAGRGDRR